MLLAGPGQTGRADRTVHVTTKRLILRLAGFLFCFAPLAALPTAAAQEGKPAQSAPPASATAPAKADYAKEPFVVESLVSRARFENDGTGQFENTARIRVQSEAGVQALGQLVFPYNSASERLEIGYVRVRRADGSVIAADRSNIQDLSAPVVRDAPLYTDAREKHVSVPALRPGEMLEYNVADVIEHPLAPGQFWFQYDFERFAITLDQQLELSVPAGRALKLKTRPGFDPKTEDTADRRIYRWSSSRHSHRDEDSSRQKSAAKQPTDVDVSISTFADWREVGAFYQALQRERIAVTPEIQKKADELAGNKATAKDKLGALYDYVATNFRYVSLSFGSGRLQPHFATDVLKNQYGDCKDQHTLLAALAAAEGISAEAVLINSQRELDADVPSPASFDHVITRVPLGDEIIWLDTTTEVAPVGFLASSLRHKQALDVPTEGAAKLVETPADPPFPIRQQWRLEGTVSDIGKLDARVHYVLSGDNELLMRLAFRRTPENDWKKLGEAIAASDGLRGAVDQVAPSNPGDTHHPFTLDYHLVVPNFLDWSGKRVQLSPPLPPLALPETGAEASTGPLQLGSPAEVAIEMKLTIPARYTVHAPVAISAAREYGEYRSTYSAERNVLSASRILDVRRREIPADQVRDFALFFRRAVRGDEAQTFFLEASVGGAPAIPQDASADDLLQAATGAYSSQRFTLAEQLLERAVARDPKHKTAWKLLGAVRLAQQENSTAIEAFRKQIEIDPYDEFAYEGLGLAQAGMEKYTDAIASFRKQLEVKPLDSVAQASLATTLVQARRYTEAATELEKAIALSPEDPRLYVSLGQTHLELRQNDKAQADFDKAVEQGPSPVIWNNIAYELSLHTVNLDRAQQYAESAVAATAAELRNADLDHVSSRDLGRVTSIASYWDTLGWVYFQRGDLKRAERFVDASWRLSLRGEVGDHLAQIYEKQGHKDEALRTYALAAAAGHTVPETRARLEALAGGAPKADALITAAQTALPRLREYSVENSLSGTPQGAADFLVLLSPGARTAAVKFVRGDSALRAAAEQLRALDYGRMFPDDSAVKLIRRGTLSCAAGAKNCTFSLQPAELVQSMD